MALSCPSTKMVLGGYSQGAAVMDMLAGVPPLGNKIGEIGSAPPLSPTAAVTVAAVAAFGNPATKFGQPLSSVGTVRRSRSIDLCKDGDPICSEGEIRLPTEVTKTRWRNRQPVSPPEGYKRQMRVVEKAAALTRRRCRGHHTVDCVRAGRLGSTAPTSRWSSPAAPMTRRVSAMSEARSSTRSRGKVGGRSVGSYAVNYPADYNFLLAGEGANDASAHVQYMMGACPNTRLVLGGYSQGAAVIDVISVSPHTDSGFQQPATTQCARLRRGRRRLRQSVAQSSARR